MQDEIGKRANLVVHDTASAPDLQPHCRVRLESGITLVAPRGYGAWWNSGKDHIFSTDRTVSNVTTRPFYSIV
jgi:hypothetical protein